MSLPAVNFPNATDTSIRRSVRRLRWFKEAFARQVDNLSGDSGVAYQLCPEKLRGAFLSWIKGFEAQKPEHSKQDYVSFASGLMLRELIKAKPLVANSIPPGADLNNPAYFWPEGYAYVAFCLNVRSAVLAQDFDVQIDIAPELDDIRTWWSFRENTAEDAALAISFLELFAGEDPHWEMPSVFMPRQLDQTALQYYTKNPE